MIIMVFLKCLLNLRNSSDKMLFLKNKKICLLLKSKTKNFKRVLLLRKKYKILIKELNICKDDTICLEYENNDFKNEINA